MRQIKRLKMVFPISIASPVIGLILNLIHEIFVANALISPRFERNLLLIIVPITFELLIQSINNRLCDVQAEIAHLLKSIKKKGPAVIFVINKILRDSIRDCNSLIGCNQAGMSFQESVQIGEELVNGASMRLWTTNTVSPSRLLRDNRNYFQALEDLKMPDDDFKDPELGKQSGVFPRKMRIVIQTKNKLVEDFLNNPTSFQEFITWHDKNNFDLRFYIEGKNGNEAYSTRLKNTISGHPPYLGNFIIKDKEFVYGRVYAPDCDHDFTSDSHVRVKLIPPRENKENGIMCTYAKLMRHLYMAADKSETVMEMLAQINREDFLRELNKDGTNL